MNLDGVDIAEFQTAGIYAASSFYNRGLVSLFGSTTVRDTGESPGHHLPGDWLHSGIHAWASESYLGVRALNSKVQGNKGHGVYLTAPASLIASGRFPVGLYSEFRKCEIFENSGDGMSLAANVGDPRTGGNGGGNGIVGGTWHFESPPQGMQSLVADANDPTNLPHGQGIINRCTINNNGEHGMRVHLYGDNDGTPDVKVAASVRVVNTMIWNNELGGFLGVIEATSDQLGPYFLVPLVHCTVAGNGSTTSTDPFTGAVADYSLEFWDGGQYSGTARYEWHDAPSRQDLMTRMFNTIFERKTSTDPDFGAYFENILLVRDDLNPQMVNDTQIGTEGIRADSNQIGTLVYSTAFPAPWGTINWTSQDPNLFMLQGSGQGNVFSITPDWIHAGGVEAASDFFGKTRPSLGQTGGASTREKVLMSSDVVIVLETPC